MNTGRSTESAAQDLGSVQGERMMKAVKVQYTVRPDYAEQNKANIAKVMAALREKPIEGLKYAAFTKEDGQTFVHLNIAKDEGALAQFGQMAEFKAFQAALKESGPLNPPASEALSLVAAGFEI